MVIMITGGSGYVGSHMAWCLRDAGENIVVLDNLSTGKKELVPSDVQFFEGDLANEDLLREIFAKNCIDTIMHFAASTVVPESLQAPLSYYRNNFINTHQLINLAIEYGVQNFILSSTAAVYGDSQDQSLISELTPPSPISPYGRSKKFAEEMLLDAAAAHGLRYTILRYFNVAGADQKGRTGQSTPNATHLIKVACEVATGRRGWLEVYGSDYPTPDGTCVRDYIHVSDLVDAHRLALIRLRSGAYPLIMNCGYGIGYSVLQVVDTIAEITGKRIEVRYKNRRPGDCAFVVADTTLLKKELHWKPKFNDLKKIVGSALAWEAKLAVRRSDQD